MFALRSQTENMRANLNRDWFSLEIKIVEFDEIIIHKPGTRFDSGADTSQTDKNVNFTRIISVWIGIRVYSMPNKMESQKLKDTSSSI